MAYQHWQWEIDDEAIVWLNFDCKTSRVNTLSSEVIGELDTIITEIESRVPKAVILYSGKKKGFIAGADVNEFIQLKTLSKAFDQIRRTQIVFDRWSALSMPTIAMISGFCLGGGLELALACRYRIVDDQSITKIGLPEIKLGIHPGWGGTVRLPRLIGAPKAMTMILTGRLLSARAAQRLGVVDVLVPNRQLKRAARYYALNHPKPHRPCLIERLTNTMLVRPILAHLLYRKLRQKIQKAHYPAPFAVLGHWMRHGVKGNRVMESEAKSVAKLMLTPQARHLVGVFFLQEQLKSLGKKTYHKHFQRVHVIGAGTMGGDIAAWCALKGCQVSLQDQTAEKIAPALQRAYQLFTKKLKRPHLINAAMDRLQPNISGTSVRSADVVIEAIFEQLEAKQQLFKSIEPQIKSDTLLATNTSSIPLDKIATVLNNSSNLVGIHYFNPVALMPLVEVVQGSQTSQNVINSALSFVSQLGKLPLLVKSCPGFLVNRLLVPYLMEAIELLNEGVLAQAIDKAALDFGMPMGPITLADTVGLDICLSVADNLVDHWGGKVPELLKERVASGYLGVKTNHGFYRYKNGRSMLAGRSAHCPSNTIDRLILRMANEAVAALSDNIVESADLLDAGLIFGTGFAPFRGGIMNYIKTRGYHRVYTQLDALAHQYGERFKPVAGWKRYLE